MRWKRVPTPYKKDGYAIVNYLGDVWGPEIHQTKEEARSHLIRFWDGKVDWHKYKLVPAASITAALPGAKVETFT